MPKNHIVRARGNTFFADRRHVAAGALVLLWCAVSALLALWYAGRIRDWSVMTDELLYAKLATAIAETGSPLPQVHGSSVSVYNQLYPLLLAPLYGRLSAPDAFRAAHVLNALLMASTAFPAYLLARQVVSRGWSFAVATLSVVVPWMVLTGFVMTESAAYPAFLWAILGLQLAVAEPSPRRDELAIAALGLAVLARTQFAALALVLPLAIVGHELGRTRRLGEGLRESVRRHRLLVALYGAGAVAAVVLAVAGSLGDLLGVYAVTIEDSILPSGVWSAAAEQIDAVAIGCGLVPLVLGGGWMLATVVRPREPREHALATLLLVTTVVLTFVSASFAVRFGRDEVVYDRYLFYVVPLLLVGAAAGLAKTPRRTLALGAAAVTVLFATTAPLLPFTTFPGINVDSAPSVLNDTLRDQSGDLDTGTYVGLLGLLAGVVLVLAVLFAPRVPTAVVLFVALGAFSVLTLRTEVNRILDGTALSGRPLARDTGLVLDWVDSVVPPGSQAGLVPYPVSTAWDTTAIRWWDAEFWNRRVTRAYAAPDGNFTYTPFPLEQLEVEWETGLVADTEDAPRYVLASPGDSRFRLAGSPVGRNVGLVVRAVERPYRALWATRGLQTDGWTRPGRAALIRFYGAGTTRVSFTLRAPESAAAGYVLEGEGVRRVGALAAGDGRTEVFTICVPASGFAELRLRGTSTTRMDPVQLSPDEIGTRAVGVLVGPIAAPKTGAPC